MNDREMLAPGSQLAEAGRSLKGHVECCSIHLKYVCALDPVCTMLKSRLSSSQPGLVCWRVKCYQDHGDWTLELGDTAGDKSAAHTCGNCEGVEHKVHNVEGNSAEELALLRTLPLVDQRPRTGPGVLTRF
jgi:hypothetical protein